MSVETRSASGQGSPWPNRLILAVYFVCFSVGTLAHVTLVLNHGFLYQSPNGPALPLAFTAVNDTFTLFNPLTLVLLIFKRRAGVAMALFVVALVFALNLSIMAYLWVTAHILHHAWLYLNGTMGVFMLVTARRLWRAAEPPSVQPAVTPGLS